MILLKKTFPILDLNVEYLTCNHTYRYRHIAIKYKATDKVEQKSKIISFDLLHIIVILVEATTAWYLTDIWRCPVIFTCLN